MLSRFAAQSLSSCSVASRALLPCVSTIPSHLASSVRPFSTTTTQANPTSSSSSSSSSSAQENVIILGAAGRDFHDFITYWSTQPNCHVRAFTGTQIPGIENRTFPPEMCNNDKNENKYSKGLNIHPESALEELVRSTNADTCALAYSDLAYDTVQKLAARANAAGCKFVQLPPHWTMVESTKPVISICASRTGVGKSQTTRYVAKHYKDKGYKIAVVRHPMPYDPDLNTQRCQRYERMEDMDKYKCTIEEREEYYSHIKEDNLLFAGVDYPMILREAEKEADIVIWDGGNNDLPFYKPDLHITLVDSLRPMDEEHYYPGEINVRMADLVLMTKTNDLKDMKQADQHAEHLKAITKYKTPILYGGSVIVPEARDTATGKALSTEEATALVKGKKVLVVDDGPTLTHGGMPYGAGYVLAQNLGAAEIVDPRPYAQGSLVRVFEKFPHLQNVLPAMGYSPEQIKDLEATIKATPCDTLVLGTPSDMTHVMGALPVPSVVALYDLKVVDEHAKQFDDVLDSLHDRFESHHHPKAA